MLDPRQIKDTRTINKLWIHEVCRVFYDRLIIESDQVWFYNLLNQCLKNKIRESDSKILFKDSVPDDKFASLPQTHDLFQISQCCCD